MKKVAMLIALMMAISIDFTDGGDVNIRDTGNPREGSTLTTTDATEDAVRKCYQCGSYSGAGAGSVSPCLGHTDKDLKPCNDPKAECMKYVNQGVIVRQCSSDCKQVTHGLTHIYCCKKNACNGNTASKPELAVFVTILTVKILMWIP